MDTLPKDPVMLLSFVNMKLRDEFHSLEEFAAYFKTSADDIETALAKINYTYNADINQFR